MKTRPMDAQMAASKDQEKVAEQLEAFLAPNHEEFAAWFAAVAAAAHVTSLMIHFPAFVRLFTEGPRGAKRARAVTSRVERSSSAKSDSSQSRCARTFPGAIGCSLTAPWQAIRRRTCYWSRPHAKGCMPASYYSPE